MVYTPESGLPNIFTTGDPGENLHCQIYVLHLMNLKTLSLERIIGITFYFGFFSHIIKRVL